MTTAIFPGSFDPMTNGHLDLILRATEMFDKVIVAVLINHSKKPLFTLEERMELLSRCIASEKVEVSSFKGLLVDFAKEQKAHVILRGLRAVSDFEYELQMAHMNRELNSEIETVFMVPQTVYSYLSSRLVKEVASLGGNISNLVPPLVEEALAEKLPEGSRAGQ